MAALLGRGVDLLAAGEADRARPLLERHAAARPDDAEGASSLGLCLLALAENTAARVALERAAALEPGRALHRWNLAAAAHREGRLGGCYLALVTYLALAEAGAADHAGTDPAQLAVARHFVADYERVARLESPELGAAELARADDDLHRARWLLRGGRAREAIGVLRGALEAAPTLPGLWSHLASACLACGRAAEARRAGLRALALCPTDLLARKTVDDAVAAQSVTRRRRRTK